MCFLWWLVRFGWFKSHRIKWQTNGRWVRVSGGWTSLVLTRRGQTEIRWARTSDVVMFKCSCWKKGSRVCSSNVPETHYYRRHWVEPCINFEIAGINFRMDWIFFNFIQYFNTVTERNIMLVCIINSISDLSWNPIESFNNFKYHQSYHHEVFTAPNHRISNCLFRIRSFQWCQEYAYANASAEQ